MNILLKILVAMALAVMAASCAAPRNDGMGDLWKGVKRVMDGRR